MKDYAPVLYEALEQKLDMEAIEKAFAAPRYHGAPRCRCGSRNTARVGESALTRQCQACGETSYYRLHDGLLVPYSMNTALAIDEARRRETLPSYGDDETPF